ncbi:hypothetical protein [Peptacetobacter sp. AB800]|uniref:hypothetical protein n=1 Tax=Peptacetobacter sp. AB800 TaxID=3388428 RepID=UPI0039FC19E0
MIKKTNKVTANKIMITNENGVLMVHEFDKDGLETNIITLEEVIKDFMNKEYVGLSLGYDVNC